MIIISMYNVLQKLINRFMQILIAWSNISKENIRDCRRKQILILMNCVTTYDKIKKQAQNIYNYRNKRRKRRKSQTLDVFSGISSYESFPSARSDLAVSFATSSHISSKIPHIRPRPPSVSFKYFTSSTNTLLSSRLISVPYYISKNLNILSIRVILWSKKSTHSKVDAPKSVFCPYGHRLTCGSDRWGIFISSCFSYRERQETLQSNFQRQWASSKYL